MDYERIYRDFIADRRAKEAGLIGYTERHHIVPRAMGGSDEPSNLIKLTAEDHFFAHLLLARVHGGGMWRAVLLMASQAPTRVGVSAAMVAKFRRHYGAAKRRLAREGNNKFNSTLFDWRNLDTGERRSACLYDMHREFGGSRASWTGVASGDRKTINGWTAEGSGVTFRGLKGKTLLFVNRDGRTFHGTQGEFCEHAGLAPSAASRIARSAGVSRCGWRLDGVADRGFNQPKTGGTSGRRAEVFVLRRDSDEIAGDRQALARALGSTPASVSACIGQMKRGRLATFKGWRLAA